MDTPPGVCASPVGGGHRANLRARRGGARRRAKKTRAKTFSRDVQSVAPKLSRDSHPPLARALVSARLLPGEEGCWRTTAGEAPPAPPRCLRGPPPPPWRPPRTARRRTRRARRARPRRGFETRGRNSPPSRTRPRICPASTRFPTRVRQVPPNARGTPGSPPPPPPPTRSAALGPWVTCAALSRRSRGRRAPPPARARRHPPRAPCARSCASCAGATGATRTNPYCAWPTTCSRRCRATKPGRRAPCSRRRMPWWWSPSTCRCAATASNSWAPPRARSRTCARRAARGGGGARRVRARHAPRAGHLRDSRQHPRGAAAPAAGARARVARRHADGFRGDAEPARAGGRRAEHARAGRQARAVRGRGAVRVGGEEAPNDVSGEG